MKKPLLATAAILGSSLAHANLIITEINSNGTPSDFWELTNFGESPVNLAGYRWDDDSANPADPGAQIIPAGTTIAAGESIVFVTTGTAAAFRSAWNLPPTVQVITGGPGLGQNDAVHLFNAANAPVTHLAYTTGGFVRSNGASSLGGHAGVSAGGSANQSMILDPNFDPATPRYTFATGVNFDSFAANPPDTGVGSPGVIGEGGVNSPPFFTSATETYWRAGTALTNSTFRITATDSDPGQSVTMSVLSKPAWLTLTLVSTGTYRLGGTPPAGGDYPITVRATDNGAPAAFTDHTVTLTAFPTTTPILLNEYNAVGGSNFLRGGTAGMDGDGVSPGPVDSHFGRIPGNGGQWVEFVVVGNGAAGSTVDMRGWTIEVLAIGSLRSIKLSDDPYWSDVVAGTILTFTTADSANGGLDTAIHKSSALHSSGFVWTNVWIGDPALVSQTGSDLAADMGIGSDDTRFIIRDAGGTAVYGPAGEGVASADTTANGFPDTLLGVSSTEVLRLQENPAPGVDPLFGNYNDGDSGSTFGAPNQWGSGPTQQSLVAFRVLANSPPVITSSPETHAAGSYSYAITTSDPNGDMVTLSASGLPDFLTLTPGAPGTATLANNRPLTLADAGQYVIRVIADDGETTAAITPQVFVLTVFHTEPSVILNEFNAVSPTEFLNGGTELADSDGPPASTDTHFGRVAGNGGRWFELVVVGDGGPSIADLRGWTIEIGNSTGGSFSATNVLELSDDSYWATVPAGTLLTFIDRDTANGGLDTGIELRDRIATVGDAWTNVWIGDPNLLDYTGAAENGYTLGSGVVTGIRIDNDDTQFVIKNAAGERVFGPAGEGIAPLSGISGTEIFELEGDPSPAVSPLMEADGINPGYGSGSESTFGAANQWQQDMVGQTQDFSPFILPPSAFEVWVASFDLEGDDAAADADPDEDGRDNREEYAFGGNPSLADAPPVPAEVTRSGSTLTWTYVRRGDDPALEFSHESSPDLDEWTEIPEPGLQIETTPHPELAGFVIVEIQLEISSSEPRFFRATVP